MNQRLLFLIVFSVIGIAFTYYMIQPEVKEELPVVNPVDVPEEMVDPELLRLGNGHRIGAFSFLDQNGNTFTHKQVEGKVFVAEYFFTTCKTICPVMNGQMTRVQRAFSGNDKLEILSFTVDPEVDNPKALSAYAAMHEADANQWHFLTGSKKALYRLARKSFFLLKPAEAENQGDVGSDFIHTNNFVLVDQQMRIRGYYDGTSPKEVDQLIHDISLLLNEPHY
jgi:protein SCO1/2